MNSEMCGFTKMWISSKIDSASLFDNVLLISTILGYTSKVKKKKAIWLSEQNINSIQYLLTMSQ